MRRAIVVNSEYRFVSALVGKDTAETFRVGDTVRVDRALHIEHMGKVAAGETAKVVFTDSTSGAVEIAFDRVVPALHAWQNTLLLIPYTTEEFLSVLSLVSAGRCSPSDKRAVLGPLAAAAAVVTAFVLGWAVSVPHVGRTLADAYSVFSQDKG